MRNGLILSLILAFPHASRAQAPQGPKLTHDQFYDWVLHDKAGWSALRLNKLEKAEYCFGKAIEVARLELDADPRLMARSYGDLAWVLHRRGRDAEAEPLARWALTVREKTFGAEKMPVAQTLYTLAAIEIELGNLDEAEVLLQRALTTCQKNLGSNAPGTADALDDLAIIYMTRRQYDKARSLYTRALTIFSANGDEHPGQVIPLDGLATIELVEGKFLEAEAHLSRIVTLVGHGAPIDTASMSRLLKRQAEIYRKTDRSDQAAKAEADAKAILDRPSPARRNNASVKDWSSPSRRRPGDP